MSSGNQTAAESAARTFKSVNGKVLDGEGSGNITYLNASKLAKEGTTGVVAQGVYVETNKNKFDKPEYSIATDDGKLIVINGAGSLDAQMKKVALGSYVRIEYLGLAEMEKGKYKGKPVHRFLVGIA